MNVLPDGPSTELIAARSLDLLFRYADTIQAPDAYASPHLSQGAVLNSIVLVERGLQRQNDEDLHAAAAHLRRAMDLYDRMPLSSSLYRGVAGLGWALQTFPLPELFPERDELLNDLDELLADGIVVTRHHNIDIINGLAGIAVYAIARGVDSEPSRALWSTLEQVYGAYLSTWSPSLELPEKTTANNLGVAHGVPGLLATAAVAHARGYFSDASGDWLKIAYDQFWSLARQQDGFPFYPTFLASPNRSRLAWCYGSLGIAVAFMHAVAIDERNAQRADRMFASSLSQYRSGAHGIRDSTLCHGQAGIALTFEYAARHLAHGELRDGLRDAAAHAAQLSLDDERPELGPCTYMHSTMDGMKPGLSLLEGSAGVALSLTAACADDTRPWMSLLGYY